MTFDEVLDRVIERAAGDERVLQEVIGAFGSQDPLRIRQAMALHAEVDLSPEQARDFEQRFQARYQPDPVTGRYGPLRR